MVIGKVVYPQHKYFPVTGVILKIWKHTLTCFGTAEETFQLEAVFSSTDYLTEQKYPD